MSPPTRPGAAGPKTTDGVMNMELERRQFLRLDEVLTICAVSKSFLYREVAAERFPPPVRVGRRAVRWKCQDILTWMESRPQAEGDTWQ